MSGDTLILENARKKCMYAQENNWDIVGQTHQNAKQCAISELTGFL